MMLNVDQPGTSVSRNRPLLAVFILAIIVLGLASRKYTFLFPALWGKYPGDALWSLMAYFLCAFLKPKTPLYRIAFYALMVSVLDEASQLLQTPWLNSIRRTTLGHLVLGTVFSWHDILAYLVGIIIGVIIDLAMRFFAVRKQSRI